MTNLSILVQKVLNYNEPNQQNWKQWIDKKNLYPISKCEGIETFVEMIQQAKDEKRSILVAGDYDCDGIMATTIMVDGLKNYGLEVGFYIPDRIKEGYGLNINTVELAYKKGYKLIITVDNGVKAFDALERASELGIQTIVTDHHTIEEFVDCDCLVHPTEMEEEFSSLCGGAVAFECIRALHVDSDFHLMCAAVASIGDVMAVTGQTRAIIQQGIEMLNKTQEPHFFALANDKTLNENSIAFQIVPKLNALGRLSHLANVNNAVRYFLSDQRIQQFAYQIDSINTQRKNMSQSMVQDITTRIDRNQDVLFIYDQTYHEGLVGLAAGSLCSSYQKPTIVATSNEGITKASMRAPLGFDCMEFFSEFDLFEAFGGHKQAAGFSFLDEHLTEFEDYLHQRSQSYVWTIVSQPNLVVDAEELSLSEVQSLDCIRPFGNSFELPTFEIITPQIQSVYDFQAGKHRKYVLTNGLTCMNFNQSDIDFKSKNRKIYSFEGTVSISQYQQRNSVNFIISKINYE